MITHQSVALLSIGVETLAAAFIALYIFCQRSVRKHRVSKPVPNRAQSATPLYSPRVKSRVKQLLAWSVPLLGLVHSPVLGQDVRRDVVVMTSFPSSFYEPFRRAFEQREPSYRLRIVNRKTSAAIAAVTDGLFTTADVFWASAPDAFELLRTSGRLAPLEHKVKTELRVIGHFPLDDPTGRFRGFAVSGYGMVWNDAALLRHGLSPPQSIAALVDPRFRGLIAMSSPSRSGTTHIMVETVLQRYGWQDGWATWLRIAGNLATITARSYSVNAGVAEGRFAVGLSIDFLGRGQSGQEALGFGYPDENAFLPASIAVLARAQEPQGALRFAAFILSEEGQSLLMQQHAHRQPLARAQAGAQGDDLFALADKPDYRGTFDAGLSGRRYDFVNLLFDELITERLARLQRLWRRIAELQKGASNEPHLLDALAEAEALATRLPASITATEFPPAGSLLKRVARGVPPSTEQAVFMDQLRKDIEAHLVAVERLVERASRQIDETRTSNSGVAP